MKQITMPVSKSPTVLRQTSKHRTIKNVANTTSIVDKGSKSVMRVAIASEFIAKYRPQAMLEATKIQS